MDNERIKCKMCPRIIPNNPKAKGLCYVCFPKHGNVKK
jgi:NMD protein affecting ribosome stability and mRNA decay